MLIDEAVAELLVNDRPNRALEPARSENEQFPIPDMIDYPDHAGRALDLERRSTSSSTWSRTRRCGTCFWLGPTGITRSDPRTRFCGHSRRFAMPERGSRRSCWRLSGLTMSDG